MTDTEARAKLQVLYDMGFGDVIVSDEVYRAYTSTLQTVSRLTCDTAHITIKGVFFKNMIVRKQSRGLA